MLPLSLLLPLQSNGGFNTGNVMQMAQPITQSVLEEGQKGVTALTSVGIGIASIIVLFVIFIYTSAILEGGRFQTKMLWPIAIYILVANFNIVSSVTVAFTSRLQELSINACNGVRQAKLLGRTNLEYYFDEAVTPALEKNATLNAKIKELQKELGDLDNEDGQPDIPQEGSGDGEEGATDEVKWWQFRKRIQIVGDNISSSINMWYMKTKYHLYRGWAIMKDPESTGQMGFLSFAVEAGMTWLIAMICQWICAAGAAVLCCMGSIMTGILVAFGPITWAFAVFPGNQRVIGSWFLRLCQFSLYAPIVALIEAFTTCVLTVSLEMSMAGEAGLMSAMFIVVLLVCDLCVIASVPSIASMVIEGATGSISLSQGLQALGSPLRGIRNLTTLGESRRDSEQLTVLKEISKKLGAGK